MTGTISPAIPIVGENDSTEEPKIPSAIITLRDALNAILTGSNQVDGALIAAGTIPNSVLAAIALSKLVPGTNAQIPISNGTAYVSKSLSGDVTIDNTGATAIGAGAVGTTELADGAVTNAKLGLSATNDALATSITLSNSYQTLASLSVSAGNIYLVSFGVFLRGPGSISGASIINLNYNGSDHDSRSISVAAGDNACFNMTVAIAISSGTAITLKAKDTSLNPSSVSGSDEGFSYTRLCVVRLA